MPINKTKKITLTLLFLTVIYLNVACFIFFFIANAVIDFIFEDEVTLTREVILNILVTSIIAGTAASLGSWIFAKIDERKARKSPPSDPS